LKLENPRLEQSFTKLPHDLLRDCCWQIATGKLRLADCDWQTSVTQSIAGCEYGNLVFNLVFY
jgi:hypothetical protein